MDDERRSQATWRPGPLQCRVEAGGHEILVDEPASAGGTGQGPQPTDLLLASMTSCLTLAVAWSAAKRGLEPTGIHVTGRATYDGPRFRRVDLEVTCDGLAADDAQRVVAAAERVCYVSNTLRRSPELVIAVATD